MEISDDDLFDKRIKVIITTENDMLFDSMIKVHMTYNDENEEMFQNKIKVCIVEEGDEDEASCFSEVDEEESMQEAPGSQSRFSRSMFQKLSGVGSRMSQGLQDGMSKLSSRDRSAKVANKSMERGDREKTVHGSAASAIGDALHTGAVRTGELMSQGAEGTFSAIQRVASDSMGAAKGAYSRLPSKEYMKERLRLIPKDDQDSLKPENDEDFFNNFIHVNFVDMKFEDMMKDKQSQRLIKALYVQMTINDIKLVAGNAREQEFIDQIKNFSMMDDASKTEHIQHKMEYIEKHGLYAIKQITS